MCSGTSGSAGGTDSCSQCADGSSAVKGQCALCPAGSYSTGGAACSKCSEGSSSEAGAQTCHKITTCKRFTQLRSIMQMLTKF